MLPACVAWLSALFAAAHFTHANPARLAMLTATRMEAARARLRHSRRW